MNVHHHAAVLDALNIASTQHYTRQHGYRATAAETAEVLNEDPRYREAYAFTLTPRQIARDLGALAGLDCPLVERAPGRSRWRLTVAGAAWLNMSMGGSGGSDRRQTGVPGKFQRPQEGS